MNSKPTTEETLWSRVMKARAKYLKLEKTLETKVEWSKEDKALDDELYSLVQTGAMALKTGERADDILLATAGRMDDRNTNEAKQFNLRKTSDSLVRDFEKRLLEISGFVEMAHDLLQKIQSLNEMDSAWEAFKKEYMVEIDLLCDNVYASPVKLNQRKERSHKKELEKNFFAESWDVTKEWNALRGKFFSSLTPNVLKEYLQKKNESFEIILKNTFVQKFKKDYRVNSKNVDELAYEIRRFHRKYFKEVEAISASARKMPLKYLSIYIKDQTEITEGASDLGVQSHLRLDESLWNGTFKCPKETFVDSVLATLYQFLRYSRVTFLNKERARDEFLKDYAIKAKAVDQEHLVSALEKPDQGYLEIASRNFILDNKVLLTNWLMDMQEAAKKEVGIHTFIDYAFTVNPQLKWGENEELYEAEQSFYSKLQQSDINPTKLNTHQARVRDGFRKTAKLFNNTFHKHIPRLVFISTEEFKQEEFRKIIQFKKGEVLQLRFPTDLRDKITIDSDLTEEMQVGFLLETLQESKHYPYSLFSISETITPQ